MLLNAHRLTTEIMRSRCRPSPLVAPVVLLFALLCPLAASAQDEAPSLGDFARDQRRNKAQQQPQASPNPALTVIDNDNLAQAMQDAKNARPVKSDKTVFSIDASSNILKVSSPDVTCSLSFNARATSLPIKPLLIENLPLTYFPTINV